MPIIDSPLRYPGGKTKLYKIVSEIINDNRNPNNCIYMEPFAGGAGLALRLLFRGDVDYLVLNDIDYGIYCFWDACLHNTNLLCEMIDESIVDVDTWNKQKNIYNSQHLYSRIEVGFATFFLNRCNVSGVIKGGLIGGKEQKGKYGITARFNKSELVSKIKKIGQYNNRIEFYNMDATDFLMNQVSKYLYDEIFLNIDPPYVKKGSLLYENSFKADDHVRLSNIIQMLRYDWIVTYDKCDFIDSLFNEYRREIIELNYSAGQTKSGNEFIIYGNSINIPDKIVEVLS